MLHFGPQIHLHIQMTFSVLLFWGILGLVYFGAGFVMAWRALRRPQAVWPLFWEDEWAPGTFWAAAIVVGVGIVWAWPLLAFVLWRYSPPSSQAGGGFDQYADMLDDEDDDEFDEYDR